MITSFFKKTDGGAVKRPSNNDNELKEVNPAKKKTNSVTGFGIADTTTDRIKNMKSRRESGC